jgi:zinc protease
LSKIQNLKTQSTDARAQAVKAMQRVLYVYDKADIRHNPSFAEELTLLQALTYADVQRFWTEFAGASVSEFSAVGALDVAVVQKDVALMLEGWETLGGAAAYQHISYPLAAVEAKRIVIATPDKPNAMLMRSSRMAEIGYSREWHALTLASDMIGRRGSSRLFDRLRKEEGLTYDTFSSIRSFNNEQAISFGIEGTFAAKNLERFEAVLHEVLTDVQKNGLTQAELMAQKKIMVQKNLANRENDVIFAGVLVANERRARDGQRTDFIYWDEIQKEIQNLTLQDINAAAARLVDSAQAVTVITGDFKNK